MLSERKDAHMHGFHGFHVITRTFLATLLTVYYELWQVSVDRYCNLAKFWHVTLRIRPSRPVLLKMTSVCVRYTFCKVLQTLLVYYDVSVFENHVSKSSEKLDFAPIIDISESCTVRAHA